MPITLSMRVIVTLLAGMLSTGALSSGASLAAEPPGAVAAPHPAEESHGIAEVPGRLVPAAIRTAMPSAYDSIGVCEGTIAPIGVILPRGDLASGCGNEPVILRHGWRDGEPGTFVFLDLPACSDNLCRDLPTSDKLRCELLIGNPCCMLDGLTGKELRAIADPPRIRPIGDAPRIGPIADALQGRFDSDTDRREGICRTWYVGNEARVLRVLLVEPTGDRDRDTYRVTGQGRLFLRERQGKSDDLLVDVFVPETRHLDY